MTGTVGRRQFPWGVSGVGNLRVVWGSKSKLSSEQGGSCTVFDDLALKAHGVGSTEFKMGADTSPP